MGARWIERQAHWCLLVLAQSGMGLTDRHAASALVLVLQSCSKLSASGRCIGVVGVFRTTAHTQWHHETGTL